MPVSPLKALLLAGPLLLAAGLAQAADLPPPKGVEGKAFVLTPEILAAHPELKTATMDLQYWSPGHKIYAQQLSNEIMAAHPELMAANFHGPVPGMDYNTLIASPFPWRIGTVEDDGDMMVLEHGIYLVAPHYKREQRVPNYEVLLPIQDASGRRKGMIVLIYKKSAFSGANMESEIFASAIRIRDGMAGRIPSYDALFNPAS